MQSYTLTVDKFLSHAATWAGDSGIEQAVPGGEPLRVGYAEIRVRANRMSGALAALGLAQGRRLGTLAWNTRHHLEIYYATMGMGVVCHTLNPRLTAAQLAVMIDEAEDTVLAVAGDLVPLALELAQLCPQVRHVIVLDTPIALAVQSDKVQLWDYETLLADKGEAVAWGAFDEEPPAGPRPPPGP